MYLPYFFTVVNVRKPIYIYTTVKQELINEVYNILFVFLFSYYVDVKDVFM